MVLQVHAVYTPTYLSPPSPIPQSSNPTEADIVAALGLAAGTDIGDLLYKSDNGSTMFSTVIASSGPKGAQTATLTYTGGSPAPTLTYIVVKDGQAGYTIWNASGWNGSDTIQVNNQGLVANKNGNLAAISHVAVYGTPGTPPPSVPDASTTMALLGMAFVGVESFRRMIKK